MMRAFAAAGYARFSGLVLFMCLWIFPALSFAGQGDQIKIFVTTDVHGYVAADQELEHIGFAALKGYIDAARAKGARTFLLDSGDMVSGSAYARLDHGRAVARLLGLMGYNGMVPGNHEFDFNADERDPLYFFKTLVPLIQEAATQPFTVTAVNVRYQKKAPPHMRLEPFVLYDETAQNPDGLRIIVAGVTLPRVVKESHPKLLDAYDFGRKEGRKQTRDNVMALLEEAVRPYTRPNDIVLVLAHVGYSEKKLKARKGMLTGKDLAAVPNVDFVLDGHTHARVKPEKIRDAWYAQGGRYLRNFTEITLERQTDGRYSQSMQLRSMADTEGCQPAPEIGRVVADIAGRYGLEKKVLHLASNDKGLFTRGPIGSQSRPLGNLVTAGMRQSTGAHFAVCSANAFRTDMLPRHLSVADVHDILPFAGKLMTANIRGRELHRLVARLLRPDTGNFPQINGLKVQALRNPADAEAPYGISAITLEDGSPLEPDKTYTLAFNGRMFADGINAREYMTDIRELGDLPAFLAAYWERTPDFPWRDVVFTSPLELRTVSP